MKDLTARNIIIREIEAFASEYAHNILGRDVVIVEQLLDFIGRPQESTQVGLTHGDEYIGTAYCVDCKDVRELEGEVRQSDSGRRMAHGFCPVCGGKLNRILGKAQ